MYGKGRKDQRWDFKGWSQSQAEKSLTGHSWSYPHPEESKRVSVKPGLWTLDWTGLWTEIWTGFWTNIVPSDDRFQHLTNESRPLREEESL